jgi:hypothetical protein
MEARKTHRAKCCYHCVHSSPTDWSEYGQERWCDRDEIPEHEWDRPEYDGNQVCEEFEDEL